MDYQNNVYGEIILYTNTYINTNCHFDQDFYTNINLINGSNCVASSLNSLFHCNLSLTNIQNSVSCQTLDQNNNVLTESILFVQPNCSYGKTNNSGICFNPTYTPTPPSSPSQGFSFYPTPTSNYYCGFNQCDNFSCVQTTTSNSGTCNGSSLYYMTYDYYSFHNYNNYGSLAFSSLNFNGYCRFDSDSYGIGVVNNLSDNNCQGVGNVSSSNCYFMVAFDNSKLICGNLLDSESFVELFYDSLTCNYGYSSTNNCNLSNPLSPPAPSPSPSPTPSPSPAPAT
jgi:hypothetical protein